MNQERIVSVVRRFCWLLRPADSEVVTDRHLLERFTADRDEASFATLVQRHGRLVFAVCRRILHDEHEAEDAFQATFLVLARKADSLRWQPSVAGWLHKVAVRTAQKLRSQNGRRLLVTSEVEVMQQADPCDQAGGREVGVIFDEELGRLPEKYRLPLLLCCIEGVGRSEAARQLGWREGTVAGRLARARDLLRGRLERRGVVLSAAALGAALTNQAAQALVPMPLFTCTVQSAFASGVGSPLAVLLANDVLRSLGASKLKVLAAGSLAALLLAGGLVGAVARPPSAAPPTALVANAPELLPPPAGNGRLPIPEAERVRRALSGGIKWLVRHQAEDGRLSLDRFPEHGRCNCGEPAQHRDDLSATAYFLLALLNSGETHRAQAPVSLYGANVERALKYLLLAQDGNGRFTDRGPAEVEPAAQALATVALCRAYASTADPILKGPAQRALNFLVGAQEQDGGWGARRRQPPELTASFWPLLALKEGQRAGLQVPEATLRAIGPFLDSLVDPKTGRYRNIPGERSTETLTAAGLLARQELVPAPLNALGKQGVQSLRKPLPIATAPQPFLWYCAVQALEPAGPAAWRDWSQRAATALLDSQDQGTDPDHRDQKGSWPAQDVPARGRLEVSALAVLTLQECQYRLQLLDEHTAAPQPHELYGRWQALTGKDIRKVREALWVFTAFPEQTLPFLQEHIRPAALQPPDAALLRRLLGQLDAEEFAARERASRELEKLGEDAEAALQQALAGKPSLEVGRRLEQLLARLGMPDDRRTREVHAVEILERLGSVEARRFLRQLAAGRADAPLTRTAKAALERGTP